MARLIYNNQSGLLGASLTNVGTTITFATAPNFATISGSDYIPLVLQPGTPNFEIVYLTAYTALATTGTIARAQEDATNWPAVAHSNGTAWAMAPTIADFPSSGPWLTYTPVWTCFGGGSANPSLGSGGTITGRYVRVGRLIAVHIDIEFGTTGLNGGAGPYQITLPVNALNETELTAKLWNAVGGLNFLGFAYTSTNVCLPQFSSGVTAGVSPAMTAMTNGLTSISQAIPYINGSDYPVNTSGNLHIDGIYEAAS